MGKSGAQSVFLFLTFLFLSMTAQAQHSRTGFYVMEHLTPSPDYEQNRRELQALKNQGHDGVSIDLWWGLVEKEKDHFNWDAYRPFFRALRDVGMKVEILFSGHACGGNVGDGGNKIPVPAWVWNIASDMQFVDVNGFKTHEVVAYNIPEYYERWELFLRAFAEEFHSFNDLITAFYPVDGPAGERRYPSYQGAAGWAYPNPGFLQMYSKRMKDDLRSHLEEKYKTIEALNSQWNSNLKSFDEIEPPSKSDTPGFFIYGYKSPYGRDILEWYQGYLVRSIEQDLKVAKRALKDLNGTYFDAPFIVKIAGIDWLHDDPIEPRAAAKAAGYVDYDRLFEVIAKNGAEVSFTAAEKKNHDWMIPRGEGWAPESDYGRSEDLLREVRSAALKWDIPLSAENALDYGEDENALRHTSYVIDHYQFANFTYLRIENLVNSDGTWTNGGHLYHNLVLKPILERPTHFEIGENEGFHPLRAIQNCIAALHRFGNSGVIHNP